MRVLLISANTASTPYSVYPLGLSMVAARVHQAGHEVKQYDFLASGRSFDALQQEVNGFSPEVIGISIRNIDNVNLLNEQRYLDAVSDIVMNLRTASRAKIILGGSGFSIIPEAILNKTGADYGIVGEGEEQLLVFLDNAVQGKYPEEKILHSAERLPAHQIPSALYDSGLMEFYLQSGHVASIQTKRGCTQACAYCSYPLLEGHSIRPRASKDIVDDIETLLEKHKAQYIFFTDSVFNDNQGNYLAVLHEMKNRKLVVPWTAFFKPDGLTKESIALMKETGLAAAEIGADAPTDATLKGLGKSFSFNDVRSCNDLFLDHEIATAHYFMFGCPGETQETVAEGIENIKGLKKTVSFIFMGIRILPQTKLATLAETQGIISADQDLLEPVYYIAPGIDPTWLTDTLTAAFSGVRNCVFPPDSLDDSLAFLHKLGYTGSLWDMLIPKNSTRGHRRK
ncbi:MAG TPA: lipid biosynthesis B12-binding/radical SAM protein [Candidatus Hydrogenedentes bacterium]|nr:lipid biosynthesis B12-binding/radical SAM protein [Candidatus Hydrogenedentota bacterium]